TSGTQEGTPLDRVLGALARSFSLQQPMSTARAGSGRSFFLTRLLREVVFREAEVAGTDVRWEQRRRLLHAAALTVTAVMAVACIVAWTISYSRNRAYVAQVETRAKAVTAEFARVDASPSTDVVATLPLLHAVRELAAVSSDTGSSSPWSMGFGLYQG